MNQDLIEEIVIFKKILQTNLLDTNKNKIK